MTNYPSLAKTAHRLALEAGHTIMRFYHAGVEVRTKDDASPVTNADEAADTLIVNGLRAAHPEIPIVSEESIGVSEAVPDGAKSFWLVDPLDGTKEFIRRTDEFTVNIALIEHGRPVLGALHLPARNETYLADGTGGAVFIAGKAEPLSIRARPLPNAGPVVVASRSHRDPETDAFIAEHHPTSVTSAGSALKFGLLARGDADLYPRFGRTMEWDTAAGHAVLAAAGGHVRDVAGNELLYGKADFANPSFIACGAA